MPAPATGEACGERRGRRTGSIPAWPASVPACFRCVPAEGTDTLPRMSPAGQQPLPTACAQWRHDRRDPEEYVSEGRKRRGYDQPHPSLLPESVATAARLAGVTRNPACVHPPASSDGSIEMPPKAGGGGRTSGTSRMRGRSNTGSASSSTATGGMNDERGKARILVPPSGVAVWNIVHRLRSLRLHDRSRLDVHGNCQLSASSGAISWLAAGRPDHRRFAGFELQLQRRIARLPRTLAPIVIDPGRHFPSPRIRVGRLAQAPGTACGVLLMCPRCPALRPAAPRHRLIHCSATNRRRGRADSPVRRTPPQIEARATGFSSRLAANCCSLTSNASGSISVGAGPGAESASVGIWISSQERIQQHVAALQHVCGDGKACQLCLSGHPRANVTVPPSGVRTGEVRALPMSSRTRFLITATFVCHLLLAPPLVTSQLLSPSACRSGLAQHARPPCTKKTSPSAPSSRRSKARSTNCTATPRFTTEPTSCTPTKSLTTPTPATPRRTVTWFSMAGPTMSTSRPAAAPTTCVRESGRFENVTGSIGMRLRDRRLMLTSSNPFVFTGKVVEKTGPDHYMVYDGTVTTCELPRPKWEFQRAQGGGRSRRHRQDLPQHLRHQGSPDSLFSVCHAARRRACPGNPAFSFPTSALLHQRHHPRANRCSGRSIAAWTRTSGPNTSPSEAGRRRASFVPAPATLRSSI